MKKHGNPSVVRDMQENPPLGRKAEVAEQIILSLICEFQ
jgi:hypothetical protein